MNDFGLHDLEKNDNCQEKDDAGLPPFLLQSVVHPAKP